MVPIKVWASQAQSINLYKNLRTKVMKCCENIYFDRQCLIKADYVLMIVYMLCLTE